MALLSLSRISGQGVFEDLELLLLQKLPFILLAVCKDGKFMFASNTATVSFDYFCDISMLVVVVPEVGQ